MIDFLNFLYTVPYYLYVLDVLLLLYFAFHNYVMILLFIRNHKKCLSSYYNFDIFRSRMGKWPKVTIQLPVFNEYYVVERLIDAVVKIDYPKSQLEIQVLDDSTDHCTDLIIERVQHYKKLNFDIHHCRREDRVGNKAGALKFGNEKAKGEFVAIFDADFIPPENFLKKTVPMFYGEPGIGMVQTRWGHVNPEQSILTKSQSIGVDGHFIIEQIARNSSELWMNFNGTAGIWRKECIKDAGDWQFDTLTEDFDLSYRAELKGWKFKYLTDVVCPAEIPSTISAFKSQQFRWCKGSLQTAMKLLPAVLRSQLNWKIKLEAVTHLLNYSIHPLMLLNIILTPFVIGFHKQGIPIPVIAILCFGTMGPSIFYLVSQKVLYQNWKKKAVFLPALMIIGTGIAINNTKAWLEGVLGKSSGFIRTPKIGNVKSSVAKYSSYNQVNFDIVLCLEICFTWYTLLSIGLACIKEQWFVIPFLFIYLAGFGYISMRHMYDLMERSLLSRRMARASVVHDNLL